VAHYIYSTKSNVMQKIQPIINGSVNPRLTPELFKELPLETKKSVIWNRIVSLEFHNSFANTEREVFEPYNTKEQGWVYENLKKIEDEEADDIFVKVSEAFKAHHQILVSKTHQRNVEIGRKIKEAQKELGFGGWLELDVSRLMGYIEASGSWNGFSHKKVSKAVLELDTIAPRMDYGGNNPNTGLKMHKWKTVSGNEYVVLDYGFISENDLKRVKDFYKSHWNPVGTSIKADSIRFEESNHGNGYFGIELVWWWD
jgi:hypothetical protein